MARTPEHISDVILSTSFNPAQIARDWEREIRAEEHAKRRKAMDDAFEAGATQEDLAGGADETDWLAMKLERLDAIERELDGESDA